MAFIHRFDCDRCFYAGCSCVERACNNLAIVVVLAILFIGMVCIIRHIILGANL